MIIPALHRQARPVSSQTDRQTAVRLPVSSWAHLATVNALFLTAAECMQAACDYPVVFVKAGDDGQGGVDYAPIAVLGLAPGENLFLQGDAWRAHQMPVLMASYPFAIARGDGGQFAVCIDTAYEGLTGEGGERLFDDAGQPTEFARRVTGELEKLEQQIQGTRAVSRRLAELGLLAEKRFDGTMPDGRKVSVDGFFMVDEDKLKALPDATLLELHRNGVLNLIHAHWMSLGQMRKLLMWRAERPA
ncbi:MAG: SapC family protein [Burkholderiaceae bacterium]|nr:SapC family protein [Rhodoferax sp.]MCP5270330.1 SapC family protein [Burkholderiaceae bacterium]